MDKEYKVLASDGFVIFPKYYLDILTFFQGCLAFSNEEDKNVIDISEQEIIVFSIESCTYERRKITCRLLELVKEFISIHEEKVIPEYTFPGQINIDEERCFVFVEIPEQERKKTIRNKHHTHKEIEFFWRIENNKEELILLYAFSHFLCFDKLKEALEMRFAQLIERGEEIFLKYYAYEQIYRNDGEVTQEKRENFFQECLAKVRAYLVEKYTGEKLFIDLNESVA